jgi:murein DD-endopeptidase MepM/ murein hydrolase activator NlpD
MTIELGAALTKPSAGPVSSPYGPRRLTGENPTLHSGIDFVGATGSPIRAVKDGVVFVAAPNGTYNRYGNVVVIKHDDPREAPYSLYAHMNSINVRKGQRVKAGQIIGSMGNTSATKDKPNNTVRTHLHFELLKRFPAPPDVDRVDPTPYLPGAAPAQPKPQPQPAYYPTYIGPEMYTHTSPLALGGVSEETKGLLGVGALFALYVTAHVLAARNEGRGTW